MSHSVSDTNYYGFLTVIDHPRFGMTGGYLVLNPTGRPIEFHCTTPIKPNRAQEILYGVTLHPFLYGEQIAQTLLTRSKSPVAYLFTNVEDVLAVHDRVETPLFFVFDPRHPSPEPVVELVDEEQAEENDRFSAASPATEISKQLNESLKSFGIEAQVPCKTEEKSLLPELPKVPGLDMDHWRVARLGNRILALPVSGGETEDSEFEKTLDELKSISRAIDLAEPFTRIRLAVEEAQRAA